MSTLDELAGHRIVWVDIGLVHCEVVGPLLGNSSVIYLFPSN